MSANSENARDDIAPAADTPSSTGDVDLENIPREAVALPASEFPPGKLMFWALTIEGLLVVLALALAYLFEFHDRRWLLSEAGERIGFSALVGVVVSAGMLLFFIALEILDWPWLAPLNDAIDELLVPLFRRLTMPQILIISCSAGIGEELFFRWCLQGGLNEWLGPAAALILVSLLFGICHWINLAYAVTATLLSIVLGIVMNVAGISASIITHAVYDFLAIIYLTQFRRSKK